MASTASFTIESFELAFLVLTVFSISAVSFPPFLFLLCSRLLELFLDHLSHLLLHLRERLFREFHRATPPFERIGQLFLLFLGRESLSCLSFSFAACSLSFFSASTFFVPLFGAFPAYLVSSFYLQTPCQPSFLGFFQRFLVELARRLKASYRVGQDVETPLRGECSCSSAPREFVELLVCLFACRDRFTFLVWQKSRNCRA
jgi:hypothetical protein